MKSIQINVAHSPDADDIFMYYALAFGWVDSKSIKFTNTALDIQSLNENALQGEYDISAISFGLYPLIAQDYALLRTGVSFGNGYGPKLIKKKHTTLKSTFTVALSGKHTTNALLFRLAYPQAKIIYKHFLDIESAVLSGQADAGVLIHESILDIHKDLVLEREIWDIWQNLSGGNLPLPLGGMALRRSLALNRAIESEITLAKAIKIALANKSLICKMLLERGLIRVDEARLNTYLNLYANADSIYMNDLQLQALDMLFLLGFEAGYYTQAIKTSDYLIPLEYEDLRLS